MTNRATDPHATQTPADQSVIHVSVTGARTRGPIGEMRFWRHAVPSMAQAQAAPGCLYAEARTVDGVHHTLTAWENEDAMRRYVRSGAHLKAMRSFDAIATGEVIGFAAPGVPSWDEALAVWRERGRPVAAARHAPTSERPMPDEAATDTAMSAEGDRP